MSRLLVVRCGARTVPVAIRSDHEDVRDFTEEPLAV